MCDTLCIHVYYSCLLLCIELHKCDRNHDIYVTCDMCALYFVLFICHITCVVLICFAFAFYSDANELYYLYSSLFHILWVHYVGLGHISLLNSLVLIDTSLYEPSMSKTSLFHILKVVLSSITKRGRLIASRPLVGFRWLMTIQDYYD